MGRLDKIFFAPSNNVVFQPNGQPQKTPLDMINAGDKPVIFKMKSTRPGLFMMRPIYGMLLPSVKVTVDLYCKGQPPMPGVKDHFTIQLCGVPSIDINPEQYWKEQKHQDEKTRKKKLLINWGKRRNTE